MTAIDPRMADAMRLGARNGSAFQFMPRRRGSVFLAWAVSVCVGFCVTAGALLCGASDPAALVVGVAAGAGVRLADGWGRS